MNIEEAKNYIKYLYRKNFLYNFHDGDSAKAIECLMNNTHCSWLIMIENDGSWLIMINDD